MYLIISIPCFNHSLIYTDLESPELPGFWWSQSQGTATSTATYDQAVLAWVAW